MRTYGRANRRLAGFRFPGGILAPGTAFTDPDKPSLELARVTSAVVSPRLGPIGLGYVFRDVADGASLPAPGIAPRPPSSSAALRVSRRSAVAPWRIHAALTSAQVGFALFPIFGKLALASIPPFVFSAFRVVGAVVILDAVRLSHTREPIRPADRTRILTYAPARGCSFNQILFILGLSLTTAINTSILTATIPVFTLAAAVALLGASA